MPSPKANILVAFYSRDGSVEALAKAVGEGAREAGAEVRLRRVPDLVSPDVMAKVPGWEERSKRMLAEYGAPTPADVEWADGIIFGTPTRFGNTSAELKAFIDSLGALWFQGGTARWKRDDGGVAVHPDGSSRIHHRANWLHSRKDCSGTWDAIRSVIDFRTAQRQADCGRACGREASGHTRHAGGRSSEGRTLKLDVTCCNQPITLTTIRL
jgi:multimeric flavodoxin WrbA